MAIEGLLLDMAMNKASEGGGGGPMPKGTGLKGLLGSGIVGKIGAGAISIGQGIKARKAEKEAEGLLPSRIGAYDQRMYNTLQREVVSRKNQALGQRGAALAKALKASGRNMFSAGGPVNYGMINRMQNQLATNMQEGAGAELANYYQMLQKQSTDIQDFSNELSLLRSTRKDAKAASLRAAANRNIGALLGQNLPVGSEMG